MRTLIAEIRGGVSARGGSGRRKAVDVASGGVHIESGYASGSIGGAGNEGPHHGCASDLVGLLFGSKEQWGSGRVSVVYFGEP